MIDLTSQLIPLIQKDPIVSTFDSRTVASHPEEVIASYNQHATTYVEFDLLRDLEQRFIDKVVRSQTPKACLVAHYGYGKTTAAIGLWQVCCSVNILAVPPAGYTSMAEIASTVYSWACNALRENEDALSKLRELYANFPQSSTEQLARLVSRRSGRPYEQVIEVLTDPALVGSLRLDPPTTNIILFLEALTHIVVANGYEGVAVFIDEFQQLLGKAGADVLTALRSLIWGLRTRKIPLGLFITMDPNSERILGERAGDILHRIKDDDLYLDFRQIHSSEFPKLLWERYARRLDLDGLTFRIVDKPALEALGQICDRPDLSNGPRTVANAFRRIASYYVNTERTYTPLQLIDDFLTGAIIFDGDANTIASLVTEFSGYAYFKHTDEHLAVLKLLAAFPAGCPPEIAERYGLMEAFQQITSDLRGDIVTLLPGGYALIDLQRVGKPLNKLSLILKKYWMQITNVEEEPTENIRRFATYMLPLLFPAGSSQSESWSTESVLSLTADNTYVQMFVGRLHSRHPLRRVRVLVCAEVPPLIKNDGIADINLVFVLCSKAVGEQKAFVRQDKSLIFLLDLGRAPEEGLPPDLRIVEHNLSPQPGTPAVLLNMIEFVERELASTKLKQSEQVQVNYILEGIRRWFLNFTFDEYLLGSIDLESATPGYRGVRDLLFREFERRFPHYSTLITSHIWRENLATYRMVLSERTLAERRGIEPIKGSKAQIAALFGQRSHAGFDSKMRIQYPDLLEVTWEGEQGVLLCTSHPLEARVLTFLGDEGRQHDNVVVHSRMEGYAHEEIEEILLLLMTRGQIKEESGRIYKVDTISAAELRRLGADLAAELQVLETVLPAKDIRREIELARMLTATDTEEDLIRQRAHAQLVSLTEKITELRTLARHKFFEALERQREDITALLRGLDKPIPSFSTAVSFKNHLEGVRKKLEEDRAPLRRSGTRLLNTIQTFRSEIVSLTDSEFGPFLARESGTLHGHEETLYVLKEHVEQHQNICELLCRWIDWGASFVRLRHNITALTLSLGESGTDSLYLAQKLDEMEHTVRENLAQEGFPVLKDIDKVWQFLEEVARDYDRNLMEREKVFEQEKLELEAAIALIAENKILLRGKYQVSKHRESYKDLNSEASQIVKEVLQSLLARTRLLGVRLNNTKKLKVEGQSTAVDRKAIRAAIQKIVECEENLSSDQLDPTMPRGIWFKNLLEKIVPIKMQIDELEVHHLAQTTLPITTEIILSKLTSNQQDLKSVLNVENALAALPIESELAALLQLYLSGHVILTVQIEDSAV